MKETEYIYLNTVLKYKFELLYFSISILYYFILTYTTFLSDLLYFLIIIIHLNYLKAKVITSNYISDNEEINTKVPFTACNIIKRPFIMRTFVFDS